MPKYISRPPLTLFVKMAALPILFESVKMVHRLTNKPVSPSNLCCLKIILALLMPNAFNVENPDT